jgi:acetoin utilization deacetylase AcuC-like enzyme
MKTVVLYSPFFLFHDPGETHPDSPGRFFDFGNFVKSLPSDIEIVLPSKVAGVSDLLSVHSLNYINHVLSYKNISGSLDYETFLSAHSVEVALAAAGASIELVDLVINKNCNGFALVRPPGHHAESNCGMGYCIFNNISIAAGFALKNGMNRVLIVDIDAHRGNGTQSIFKGSENVRVFSVHQEHLFPSDELQPNDWGAELSIPVPTGSADIEYARVFETILIPFVNSFRPNIILVSAGFDAHIDDPMSELCLTDNGYKMVFDNLCRIANEFCAGRIAYFLEGGYDNYTLKKCILHCCQTLTAAHKEV